MKKRISIAVSVVALALLLIAGTVAVTVAYLTSKTDTVTNTFTVGNVTITLDETKVGSDGKAATPAERTIENSYKLFPNGEYLKDPTIHVDAASSDCYLFVKVTNDLEDVEDSSNTIAKQLENNGWKALAGQDGVYYLNSVATAGKDYPVFTTVKIAATATNADLSAIVNAEGKGFVTVIAYAIQVDGFADAAAAWAAAPAEWNN